MYRCGINIYGYCVTQKGLTFFYVMASLYTDALGLLSIDAVVGRTAGLKNGVRFPRTIL